MKDQDPDPSPIPEVVTFGRDDDPLAMFSDEAEVIEQSTSRFTWNQARPGEITGYVSSSGSRFFPIEDHADDWSEASAPLSYASIPPGFSPHDPPAALQRQSSSARLRAASAAAALVAGGLLVWGLSSTRPERFSLNWWQRGRDVIELPPVPPPAPPRRLADEPGRIAGKPAEPINGHGLDAGDTAASASPPAAQPTPSPSALTRALNAAALAPEAAPPMATVPGVEAARPASLPAGKDADEATRVKQSLSTFQAAYSALDAQGTQAVWPSVDATALGRVFQTLASQQLELTNCRITLNGEQARALCNGRTRSVPKDRAKPPRVESRQWRFDLAKGLEGWNVEALNIK